MINSLGTLEHVGEKPLTQDNNYPNSTTRNNCWHNQQKIPKGKEKKTCQNRMHNNAMKKRKKKQQ
jgi:hypothetical protein